jgi:hypothetical protein
VNFACQFDNNVFAFNNQQNNIVHCIWNAEEEEAVHCMNAQAEQLRPQTVESPENKAVTR